MDDPGVFSVRSSQYAAHVETAGDLPGDLYNIVPGHNVSLYAFPIYHTDS